MSNNNNIRPGNVIPWLLLAGGALVAKQVFGKIFFDPNADANKQTQKTVQSEIDKKEKAGERASFSAAQYKTFADTLFSAMEGMGTDEDTIYRIIDQMKNELDMLKLIEAFGIRWYKEFAFVGQNYNLGQWFQNELSESELQKVNSILQQKNIAYKF